MSVRLSVFLNVCEKCNLPRHSSITSLYTRENRKHEKRGSWVKWLITDWYILLFVLLPRSWMRSQMLFLLSLSRAVVVFFIFCFCPWEYKTRCLSSLSLFLHSHARTSARTSAHTHTHTLSLALFVSLLVSFLCVALLRQAAFVHRCCRSAFSGLRSSTAPAEEEEERRVAEGVEGRNGVCGVREEQKHTEKEGRGESVCVCVCGNWDTRRALMGMKKGLTRFEEEK